MEINMRRIQKNILTGKIIKQLNDSPVRKKDFVVIDELILASAQIAVDVIEEHLSKEEKNAEYIDEKIKDYINRAKDILRNSMSQSFQADYFAYTVEIAKMIQIEENK